MKLKFKNLIKRNKNFIGKSWVIFVGNAGFLCKQFSDNFFFLEKRNRIYFLNKNNDENLIKIIRFYTNLISVTISNHLKLKLIGVGYRFELLSNKILLIKLGYSHELKKKLPSLLNLYIFRTHYLFNSINLNLLKNFLNNLRSLRKPEPYKGKGVRYDFERIRRKEGKKGNV